ncbi:protein-L-isoaspartate O-methyltransferase [Candidatus Dojkabacteria bacterium]|uniref:Protein-L-isoaspartate O-methyltransferase n=1 Tax=Candidatus Dojkabacteria bacterium TaxID=2099670 RepID=A0A955KZT7_9BACT|nr:protein-L-isoaspartate O-methyltransferase [Candidatus Dojkabacteria bacterium]
MNDIDSFGGSGVFSWTHKYLNQVLTTGQYPVVKNPLLKKALLKIQREDFVPAVAKDKAFQDIDVLIEDGTILNKPTLICEMLELLDIKESGKYLDIGTGSGWLASLIAEAVGPKGVVYTMERIESIARKAVQNIRKYPELVNLFVIFRDGSNGLPEYAPYDGIHMSVAMSQIPVVIKSQLAIGGRMVIPTLQNDIRLIVRVSQNEFRESVHQGYYFDPIKEGIVVSKK